MPDRMTRAVMLLAAFAMAFALVCPVAVTPIFVQNHHSPHIDLAVVLAHIITVVVVIGAAARTEALDEAPCPLDVTDRNCVRLC